MILKLNIIYINKRDPDGIDSSRFLFESRARIVLNIDYTYISDNEIYILGGEFILLFFIVFSSVGLMERVLWSVQWRRWAWL